MEGGGYSRYTRQAPRFPILLPRSLSMPAIDPEEPVSELRHIPIEDCGEPLVDFTAHCDRIYWAPRHPVFDYQRLRLTRQGVAERLCRAACLLPPGLRLAVVEGYRHPQIQQAMFEATRDRLAREHPEWSEAELRRETEKFSAPMDEFVPQPHTTGGAVDVHLVDVHLVDAAGQLLDFTSPYELLDPRGAPANAAGLTAEAESNRALLRRVMGEAGFTNYPSEWWHWSYGDQAWAYRGGHPAALYAAVEPHGVDGMDFTFQPHETPGY